MAMWTKIREEDFHKRIIDLGNTYVTREEIEEETRVAYEIGIVDRTTHQPVGRVNYRVPKTCYIDEDVFAELLAKKLTTG